jgi:hypothetical protein
MATAFVRGTIAFGRGRDQLGVLIEPTQEHEVDPENDNQLVEFRNKIWYG